METSSAIADALKVLWGKFLPQMLERVAVIEDANRVQQAGTLSAAQRAVAAAAAHKLAGVLGTFGLTAATEVAREAEEIYASDAPLDEGALIRLEAIAQELTAAIRAYS
jgi:HPt (histidine-containing phosphotransfer) domain-containing protein